MPGHEVDSSVNESANCENPTPNYPPDAKLELGKRGETELRSGMELLGKDKKAIMDLLVAVDP